MMNDIRIIALAKDWDDVPTCITHVMRMMGEDIPVLWIDSIGTRRPSIGDGRDLQRILRRLRSGGRTVFRENHLSTLAPLLIPMARSQTARSVNRRALALQTANWRRQHPAQTTEYWCATPNAVDLLPRQGGRVIYYAVDDWSRFAHLDGPYLEKEERRLLTRADAVLTPARYLADKLSQTARETGRPHLPIRVVPHAVDTRQFGAALNPNTVVPEILANGPRPRIGFYGNLREWIDYALIRELARRRPDWTLVLAGPASAEAHSLRDLPNILLPGRIEHADLPAWCKGFDAAMIPYRREDPRMTSVNPVKLKELLAAGVPVAACDIPELRGWGDDVQVCRSVDEWIEVLARQAARQDRPAIAARMAKEDWSARAAEVRAWLDGVAGRVLSP